MNISDAIQYLQGNENIHLRPSQQGKLGIEADSQEDIQDALSELFQEAAPGGGWSYDAEDYDDFCKIVKAFMKFEIAYSGTRNVWVFNKIKFDKSQEKSEFQGQVE